ncbi:hypothetical protein CDD80_1669 [Ophiocordyceps camponoti-rufipedis]|uniref:Ubiquitin-activating enzyme E1-like n=1 Tax=Ophiocordyceps camponoti-rufipedis TaxID=2004952 RepID=A0A2C5YDY1_9HYPO|nr:hypothetical protein CDD80_1669 [Ophiocordyceps camponoti-rufipedis]
MDEAIVTAAPSASAPVAPSSSSTVDASSQQLPQPGQPLQQRPRVVPRDRFNHQSLGPSLNAAVKQARVLMVGAGGIGCELLKDLVLTGFGEIHVVDLDTIDLSNLNRQFLFRHEHIKKSKALVAKEAAQKFNPGANIVAYHANIKDDQFNVAWFRRFNIVYNALDNLDARRHVNRMCLAADVPLIESGTTGFNGQVQAIKKGVTACYDCSPKETPKSFPVCTIRSTPSQPIHCIVWGKSYLLNEMFGASEDASAFDHSTTVENAQEIEELKREAGELKEIRAAVGTDAFPQMLFDKVFGSDIERLRSVEDMWKSRRPPEALAFDAVMLQARDALASKERILADDQAVWSLEESLVVFVDSLQRLSKRMLHLTKSKEPSAPEPAISFDKDDQDTLDFVASSANIRSTVFGIDRKSRFEIKQMAGNIIPAIATTNAIVAGVCVLESFKVLRGDFGQSKEIFLTPFAPARLLAPNTSRKPNPDCPVCGVFNASIMVDLGRATLNNVVQDVVRGELGFGDREFSVSNDVGILYDVDETDNLSKKLSDLGINNGSLLTVVDDGDENPLVNVVLDVEERPTDDEEKPVRLTLAERPNIPQKPTAPEANGDGQQNGAHDAVPKGVKRGHSEDDQPPTKKVKTADSDVVVVDDSGGAILIADD